MAQAQWTSHFSLTPRPCSGQLSSRQVDGWAPPWGLGTACCVWLAGRVHVGGRALFTHHLRSHSLTSHHASTLTQGLGKVRPVGQQLPGCCWALWGRGAVSIRAPVLTPAIPRCHCPCVKKVPLVLGHQELTALQGPLRFCELLGRARPSRLPVIG